MSKRTVVLNNIIYLLSIFILVNAIPIDNDKDDKTDIPPLIEFKNGGIRINFAGYHAEAGLGGLLTGSKTGGGLHASAGTPSGAHASAGLGGLLEDGSIGGGLHARAGLGNGGLGVRAGLGGVLGGSEKSGSKTTGVLYADSNLKDFINIPKLEKAQKHKHSKNIQVIPPPSKKSEDDKQSTVKGPLDGLKSLVSSEKVEFHPADPLALKYAFDKVVLVDDTNENKEKPIDKLTKIKAEKAELKKNSDESDSDSSSTSDEENKELKDNAIIKQSAPVDDKDPRPARKYFKKRLQERTEPAQRYIDEANEKLNNERYRRSKTGLFVRSAASAEASEGEPNTNGNGRKFRGQTLFDDIFNIPISALNAVNKLLNNIHKKE